MRHIEIILHIADEPSEKGQLPSYSRVELFYRERAAARTVFEKMLAVEQEFREVHGQEVIYRSRAYTLHAEPGVIFNEGKGL